MEINTNLEILKLKEQLKDTHNRHISIYKETKDEIIVYNFDFLKDNLYIERVFYSKDFKSIRLKQLIDHEIFNREKLFKIISKKFLSGYKILDKEKNK